MMVGKEGTKQRGNMLKPAVGSYLARGPGGVGRTTRNLGKPADSSQVAGKVLQGLILKTDTMILEFIFSCAFFF